MGKYMRKSKATSGGVALMEVSHTQASLGVRTRARVALERLQKSASAAGEAAAAGGGSYLQLRSRRLEKISPIGVEGRRQKNLQKDSNSQSGRGSSRLKPKVDDEEIKEEKEKVSLDGEKVIEEENLQGNEAAGEENKKGSSAADLGVDEAFFGENVLEIEGRGRNTRETTPCNLISNPDSVRTPGSSTRPTVTNDANSRENSSRRDIPTTNEMDEFFAGAEEQQQKKFIEKYNFDPVNDKPLPGRFEWEKINP